MVTRDCPLCDKEFEIDEDALESVNKRKPGNMNVLCGKCYRNVDKKRLKEYNRGARLKELYGITIVQYNEMFKNQDYSCKICREKPQRKKLAVDHDHATGKIRGLLCQKCNLMLGYARDNIKTLENGISYLKENEQGLRVL